MAFKAGILTMFQLDEVTKLLVIYALSALLIQQRDIFVSIYRLGQGKSFGIKDLLLCMSLLTKW